MRFTIILQLFFLVLGVLPSALYSSTYEISEISVLSVNSAITPGTYDYLQHNFKKIPKNSVVLIKINTPGGLVTTTKDIITMIGREKKPVIIWITPEGASASSAGAIIASAAHLIYMSPGTNMGAATPVGLGEDIKEGDGKQKALKDLSALVRSLNESRNRPSAPFEKMVTEANSYTDKEALKLGIINGVISNEREIIDLITNKKISIDGESKTLTPTPNTQFKEYAPTLGQKILEVLANPSTAYFLFLIGVALIYFEFQMPGGYIAGAVGICFLMLAGIAFQVLPLNWGSMGLILLGMILLVAEVFITSYGILSLAGLASFVMGSLFLFHGESGYINIEYPMILSTLAGVVASIAFLLWYLWQDQKKQAAPTNFFLPIGAIGLVFTKKDPKNYQVKVRGEIWHALSAEELEIGDKVEVSSVDPQHLRIEIKKVLNT